MRRYRKKIAKEYIELLEKAHGAVRRSLESGDFGTVLDLLGQCQEAAIQLGTMIEEEEGEGFVTVGMLEDYCELVFQIHTLVSQNRILNSTKVHKQLKKQLIVIENSIRCDIRERLEMVFLPYKVSMWDSLESVWMAADADESCDAYVIPIPYFDRNPDGSLGQMHYEGGEYPSYVPVTGYEEYDFEERQPDAIFIHNPYDNQNFVTSVHPFFYSSNLKRFTDYLVYIPYYSTSGGMSEGQKQCPAYYHADLIVIQAEKYRKFFDEALPPEKLAAMGSPKFDRVIRLCENPPEVPEAWKQRMAGKKVYFYNTSINGMLGDTEAFLKKMEYVFRCFEGRTDACLLWRPHPLLESTFESMRPQYKVVYDTLKRYFIMAKLGIYDDSPDMTDAVVHSDAYIGDSATSVTSVFGIVGKPLFVLNNGIHSAPGKDDWRGEIIRGFSPYLNNDWMVTQGNKLYHAPGHDYQYQYCCDLSEYARGNYYIGVVTVNGKNYVCPANAQDIVVVGEQGIQKRIPLKKHLERVGAFYGMAVWENYLFLIPNQYPSIVRYDTAREEIRYYERGREVFTGTASNGEQRLGGYCVGGGKLYLASPLDARILVMDVETGEQRMAVIETGTGDQRAEMTGTLIRGETDPREHQMLTGEEERENGTVHGFSGLVLDGRDIWCLPYEGRKVFQWNPESGQTRSYGNWPEKLICRHPSYGYECNIIPFNWAAFYKKYVYLSPGWGNMYVRLDRESGKMAEWIPPFKQPEQPKSDYYLSWSKGNFVCPVEGTEGKVYLLFSAYDRKLYQVDLGDEDPALMDHPGCQEIAVEFDPDELLKNEPGFGAESQWLQYCCLENSFNSLTDFLDGRMKGNTFDRESQLKSYGSIAANHDGTSGEKIYGLVRKRIDS